ncbi:hypothetical protein GUJ93_ZPchr0012g20572 [Zizania palustris]|uniref:Uncharacterized protein n=1 Tax=Zizania palustris TaxID=103762 RepID=A0A8J5WMY1_ZIZPA|nr:hypothetical protein GUJ93_ZPchr0012g20572 [Zizania palustris]
MTTSTVPSTSANMAGARRSKMTMPSSPPPMTSSRRKGPRSRPRRRNCIPSCLNAT